ncbi:MAG: hypothetical protein VXZ15_13130, partial [Planctomycetota bacterium]|nr:hypothetical protein [Planctomycetota bacterium]
KRHVSRKLARNNPVARCHVEILRDAGRINTGDKAGLLAEEGCLRGDMCSKGPAVGAKGRGVSGERNSTSFQNCPN